MAMNQQFAGTIGRPGSGLGMRPGSQGFGPGGVPPGSSMGRTSYGPVAGVGSSLNRPVEVAARPTVIREGMKASGSATSAGRSGTSAGLGPGRSVVDRSYYVGLLRPKVADLTAEIERLRGQEEQINRSSTQLVQLQAKSKTHQDEIQKLKATLSDLNYAVENMTNGDPEMISSQAQAFRAQNVEQRRSVDKLFLAVKDLDGQCRVQSQQLEQEVKRLDQRIQEEEPGAFAEYVRQRDDSYRVADQVLQLQTEIRSLIARQDLVMQHLGQDPDKKRASQLLLEVLKKRQTRDEMAKECSISVEEERTMLIGQVKSIQQDNIVLERKVKEAHDLIDDSKQRVAQLNEELREYSGDNAQKFLELQEKDREMQDVIDTFPQREAEELAKLRQVEETIQQLLEQTSRSLTLKASMPQENAPQILQHLASELSEKENSLEAAKVTKERLQKELQERKEELEKVQFLDEKITAELEATQRRTQEQQQEIIRYGDLDSLRQNIEARRKALMGKKAAQQKVRDAGKLHIHTLNAQFEALRARVAENSIQQGLAAEETKLMRKWGQAFAHEEVVRAKEKESQYTAAKGDVLRMADEINAMLKDPKRFNDGSSGGVLILGK